MGKIADLLPLPESVNIGRGNLELRGIDLKQLATLLVVYKDQMLSFMSGDTPNFAAMVVTAPHMVADIIAAAADAQDETEQILRIPAAAQIECLSKIYRLSVPDEKKLYESLAQWVEKAKQLQKLAGLDKQAAKPSTISSETSSPVG